MMRGPRGGPSFRSDRTRRGSYSFIVRHLIADGTRAIGVVVAGGPGVDVRAGGRGLGPDRSVGPLGIVGTPRLAASPGRSRSPAIRALSRRGESGRPEGIGETAAPAPGRPHRPRRRACEPDHRSAARRWPGVSIAPMRRIEVGRAGVQVGDAARSSSGRRGPSPRADVRSAPRPLRRCGAAAAELRERSRGRVDRGGLGRDCRRDVATASLPGPRGCGRASSPRRRGDRPTRPGPGPGPGPGRRRPW